MEADGTIIGLHVKWPDLMMARDEKWRVSKVSANHPQVGQEWTKIGDNLSDGCWDILLKIKNLMVALQEKP